MYSREFDDSVELMHRMWDKAKKYHGIIERARARVKKFGLRRFFLPFHFHSVRKKIAFYEQVRFNYVSMALSISRKLNLAKRAARERRRFDH